MSFLAGLLLGLIIGFCFAVYIINKIEEDKKADKESHND